MKKLVVAGVALGCLAGSASADDMDRQIGLIVSGVVDKWAGVQIIDGPDVSSPPQQQGPGFVPTGTEALLASGGEGLLSIPLGDNLSIQNDFKYELNSNATDSTPDVIGPRYFYQGAAHLSWRDPSSALVGVFGGVGVADMATLDTSAHFVGGEAQLYMGDLTFYAQGGFVGFSSDIPTADEFEFAGLDDGFFARGVVRWFPTTDSRLQLEGTYLNTDFAGTGFGGMEAVSVKARYDFMLNGMPLIGDLPVFIAYRGTFRNDCLRADGAFRDAPGPGSLGIDDHLIMIGTSYSFSGDRLAIDRRGATLDTPDFTFSCVAQRFLGEEEELD